MLDSPPLTAAGARVSCADLDIEIVKMDEPGIERLRVVLHPHEASGS